MYKKKNQKKNKNIDLDVDRNNVGTIINIMVILGIVTFGFISIYRYNEALKESKVKRELYDVWEADFERVENEKVGVQFDNIDTTTEEFDKLKNKCHDFIENKSDSPDKTVDTNLVVSEQVYADGDKYTNGIEHKGQSNMVETGPIYFNDGMLVRYINTDGKMKIISSIFTDNKNGIEVLEQDNIAKEIGTSKVNINTQENSDYDRAISEDEYKQKISYCIQNVLQEKTKNKKEALRQALGYFTVDGKNALVDCINSINVKDNESITASCIVAGKSDTSKSYKDRIFIQYRIGDTENGQLVNLVIKINSNLRVFDIDMI